MKVYYPGPDVKTYHPQLGKLTRGLFFELDDNLAKVHIDGGLLKEAKEETLEVRGPGSEASDLTSNLKRSDPQT